jgi:hypothetical protein
LATIAELMGDIARDEVELKELTMTEEPALGMLETLNNVRQKLGFCWRFKRRDWEPWFLFHR